jgi:hypothetical protein
MGPHPPIAKAPDSLLSWMALEIKGSEVTPDDPAFMSDAISLSENILKTTEHSKIV